MNKKRDLNGNVVRLTSVLSKGVDGRVKCTMAWGDNELSAEICGRLRREINRLGIEDPRVVSDEIVYHVPGLYGKKLDSNFRTACGLRKADNRLTGPVANRIQAVVAAKVKTILRERTVFGKAKGVAEELTGIKKA